MFNVFDLISKRTVENFRTAFIETTGMSLSFADSEHKQYNTFYAGSICEFCKALNSSVHGLEKCIDSARKAGKRAAREKRALTYSCHAGLVEIVVPIIIDNRHVGSVFSGQVLTRRPTEQDFERVRKKLADASLIAGDVKSAYLSVPVVPEWKISIVVNLLTIIVDYMVETELNHVLEEQIKKEKEKLSEVVPYIRNEFANNILYNNVEKLSSVKGKLDLLGLRQAPNIAMLCKLDRYDAVIRGQDELLKAKVNNLALQVILDELTASEDSFVHPLGDGAYLILLAIRNHLEQAKKRGACINIAERIRTTLKSRTAFTCTIGIGRLCRSAGELGLSYKDAQNAQMYGRMVRDDQVIHIDDILLEEQTDHGGRIDFDRIRNSVVLADKSDLLNHLGDIFRDYADGDGAKLNKVKAFSLEILNVVINTAADNGISDDVLSRKMDYLERLFRMESAQDVLHWLEALAVDIVDSISEKRKNKSIQIIEKAQRYILDNYANDISLEEVAAAVYLSPNYFGWMFKKEVGVSCVEYITKIRMGHAKRLMESGQKSILAISEEVGYKDSNYFSQVFKKLEGVRPSEYRKKISGKGSTTT